jgi:hypothetical protein
MAIFPQRLKSRRFAVSLIVVLLLGVVVGAVIGTSGKVPAVITGQQELPLVTSGTVAIRVVALQRSAIGNSPILNVSLQNTSSKTIKAYSVGSGKSWVTRSYYFSETGFLPNTIESQIIPLGSPTFRTASRDFTVTGVLFEDGSTDGQAIPTFRLRENWMGVRAYASHLFPCLRQLPLTLARHHEAAIVQCETEMGKGSPKGRSTDFEDGFRNAQRESSDRLNEIKNTIQAGNFSEAGKHRDKIINILETLQRE